MDGWDVELALIEDWRRWYETVVPEAERRYDRYLRDLQETKQ